MSLKRLLTFLAILVFVSLAFATYLFWPIALPPISDDVLHDADAAWERHMLNREGAYYTLGNTYRPSFSDRAEQYPNSISGGWSTSTIIIKVRDHEDVTGNYLQVQGGPMDIVEGDAVNYILYGKEIGQYHMPSRGAWNNEYYFSHADYYLVRENTETDETEIIRAWLDKPDAYGQLSFDTNTSTLTISLCGVGSEELIVTDILNPQQPSDERTFICTSPNTTPL